MTLRLHGENSRCSKLVEKVEMRAKERNEGRGERREVLSSSPPPPPSICCCCFCKNTSGIYSIRNVCYAGLCTKRVQLHNGTGLGQLHSIRFIVLGHQYGGRDVM